MMHIDTFFRSAVGASAKRSGARITTSCTPPIMSFKQIPRIPVGADLSQYTSNKENDMLQLSQRIGPWWLGCKRLQRDQLKHLPEGHVLGGLGRRWRVGVFALKLGGAALDHARVAAQLTPRPPAAAERLQQ